MADEDLDKQEDNSRSKLSLGEDQPSLQEPVEHSTEEPKKSNRVPAVTKSVGLNGRIRSIPEKCPRSCACICGIVVPLWLLIFFALLGGNILAQLEAPAEYDSNDAIMASQNMYFQTRQAIKETMNDLMRLPSKCLVDYFRLYKPEGSNITLYDLLVYNSTILDAKLSLYDLSVLAQFPRLDAHMRECGSEAEPIVNTLLKLQNSTSIELAADSLTFNWIRCWNVTKYGDQRVFTPTDQLIQAASDQPAFYRRSWHRDKEYLYNQYLADFGDNITDSIRLQAYLNATSNATGREGCSGNVAASAWFFFTVMTTIGYGNQVIQTGAGRGLVACMGFFGILAFGAVSAAAAQILIVVFDDFVARFNLKVLSRPAVGVVLWTFVALTWTLIVADRSFNWWKNRLPEYEQPYASFWDSVWFAYLTTTTIGLGDFYYQPNYIFVADLFTIPLACLVCFVFFATLISQIASLMSGTFPNAVENLRKRVERTNLVNTDLNDEVVCDSKLIEVLLRVLEDEKGESEGNASCLAVLLKEEKLLQQILEIRTEEIQKQTEMGSK